MNKMVIYKLTPSLHGGGVNNTLVCLNNNHGKESLRN